jgi:hypothetical protein
VQRRRPSVSKPRLQRTVPSLPPISEDRPTGPLPLRAQTDFPLVASGKGQTKPNRRFVTLWSTQVAEDELRQAEEAEAEAARR